MKLNENICIAGRCVTLVPYKEYHVPKYHNWMKSEELQYQTGSEPLSLEDEYNMQKSWLSDENKCTFIVLDRFKFEETGDEVDSMIGDTNLFLSDENISQAEAEIMIAEESARRKKRGWEAMLLMLRYGCEELKIQLYEVKIKLDNSASVKMFTKIGFLETGRSEVFGECTLQLTVTAEWLQWLSNETEVYNKDVYGTGGN